MPSPVLRRYQDEFGGLEGFFLPLAMATWDLLFAAQDSAGLSGGLLEIGVFKGKSAALGAMYMKPGEPCYFLDLHETPGAKAAVEKIRSANNHFLKMNSADALNDPALAAARGALRWIHIDGEHTGYATRTDLHTAAALLSDGGLICVDDFFSFKYPQLTAAVYSFLFERPMEFRMVMAAANKCYICRAGWAARYDAYIREHAVSHLSVGDNEWTLARTSYLHDFGCFTVIARNKGRDVVGLDRDMDKVVF